jgi:hypothetical protein
MFLDAESTEKEMNGRDGCQALGPDENSILCLLQKDVEDPHLLRFRRKSPPPQSPEHWKEASLEPVPHNVQPRARPKSNWSSALILSRGKLCLMGSLEEEMGRFDSDSPMAGNCQNVWELQVFTVNLKKQTLLS